MQPLSYAEINLSHLASNLSLIRRRASGGKVMAAVKANAYGHGLVPVARSLAKLGVDYLAVAFDTEGVELRQNGVRTPILVLTAVSDYRNILEYGLTPTVFSFESLNEVKKLARNGEKMKKKIPVHLDIDTGMGRIGINPAEAGRAIDQILGRDGLRLEGIFTHLSSSDNPKDPYTMKQLALFDRVLGLLEERKVSVPLIHAANSGGILNFPCCHFNMIRPGIALYGCSPDGRPDGIPGLKPLLELKTKIFHIKTVSRATGIGYNHTYTARKGQVIATIAAGYGDGYNRLLSNRGRTIVADRWAPIVGRVSMDQTTIDVTAAPSAKIGDEVVLIGRSKTKSISAADIAKLAGTISYEVFCDLSMRVKRVYVG